MSTFDTLIKSNIPAKFWPALGPEGEPLDRWQGRKGGCKNSFAQFKAEAGRTKMGREHLRRHHGGNQ